MNSIVRKRLTEIAVAAAVFAALVTAVAAGTLFIHSKETERLSLALRPMAEKALGVKGNRLTQREAAVRGPESIYRAFQYRDKDGKLLGAGLSIRIALNNAGMGVFAITDERGRVRAIEAWPGVSGVRAEELGTYLDQREKGSQGGLGPSADRQKLEYSVEAALGEAALFVRSWDGSKNEP